MTEDSSSFLVTAFTILASGICAYLLLHLLSPGESPNKRGFYFARSWLAWAVSIIVLITLPGVFKTFSADSILRLLIGCSGFGATAFAIGYLWGLLFTKDDRSGSSAKVDTLPPMHSQATMLTTVQSPPVKDKYKQEVQSFSDDSSLYVRANADFNKNRADDGLRIKCMTNAGGDVEKARYLYIAEQVKRLSNSEKHSDFLGNAIENGDAQQDFNELPVRTEKAKCFVCANSYAAEFARCPACHSLFRVGEQHEISIDRITCDMGHFYYRGEKFEDRESARARVKETNAAISQP